MAARLVELDGSPASVRSIAARVIRQLWPNETLRTLFHDSNFVPGEGEIFVVGIAITAPAGEEQHVLVLQFGVGGESVTPANRVLVEEFPDDSGLPGLARVADRGYVAELLDLGGVASVSSPEILRYRPHERCVLRYHISATEAQNVSSVVAKIFSEPDVAKEVWDTLLFARSRLNQPDLVVRPLLLDERTDTVFMEGIDGPNLGQRIDEAGSAEAARAYAELAARCLVQLHALPGPTNRLKTLQTDALKFRGYIDAVAALDEVPAAALIDTLNAIQDAGEALDEPEYCFVHGGFKPTQLLMRGDGTAVIVDFDGSSYGDPAMDLGRFMSKVRLDALRPGFSHLRGLDQVFGELYCEISGRDIMRRAYVLEALSLLRIALRRLELRPKSARYLKYSEVLLRESRACIELSVKS
jgi:hypothetical protein